MARGGDQTAGKPRYPLAALIEATGRSEAELARMVGLSGSSLVAARERGLIESAAERYAVRAGLHPFNVWPEMADAAVADAAVACRGCGEPFVPVRRSHVFCDPACGRRFHAEVRRARSRDHYWRNRERILAQQAAYREECREQLRDARRAYLARKGEEARARARERYATDPEYRERRKAASRRYKAEAREALRRKNAAYYRATRDRQLAAKRERAEARRRELMGEAA
ncbi:MAG TPA: hypothetical protein VFU14_20350 [Acidimicrobiales bacterium]|nr:hypothetical protein [Acidimicrobiales bacterium]